MVKFRYLWGEKLENQMNDLPKLTDEHENALNQLFMNHTPYVVLKFREGKGWSMIEENCDGGSIYEVSLHENTHEQSQS